MVHCPSAMPKELVKWLAAMGRINRNRLNYVYLLRAAPLEEIEERCAEEGIAMPYVRELRDPVNGGGAYLMSFLESKSPAEDVPVDTDLSFLSLAR